MLLRTFNESRDRPSGMKGLPEFPARPDLSKMNDEGYKILQETLIKQ